MHKDGFKDAAVIGVVMRERIFVESAPDNLDPDRLKKRLTVEDCGAIVSFTGITRGSDNGENVLYLEFDSWEEKLKETLYELSEEAINKFNVKSIAISHRTGLVKPTENIVSIHVASAHRKEAFEGCSWLIDELKNQAPIWKKEVKPSGSSWKSGLG